MMWFLLIGGFGLIGWLILGFVAMTAGLLFWIDSDVSDGEEK